MKKTAIAIITARGGSKRIPRKNIKLFRGKPIIAYPIAVAIDSGCFDEVMVSTDDAEIADIARNFGASVPFFRSRETASDFASTNDVLQEVLKMYSVIGSSYNYGCCIYPTASLLSAEDLKATYNRMIEENAQSALSVIRYSYPPQRALVVNDGNVEYWMPEYSKYRTQDLPALYHDAGQFYWFSVKEFIKSNSLLLGKTIIHEFLEHQVQDIDNESDWKLAELKYDLLFGSIRNI